MIDHIWEMITMLARFNLIVRVNFNKRTITINQVAFTLPEFTQLIEEELWRPLV